MAGATPTTTSTTSGADVPPGTPGDSLVGGKRRVPLAFARAVAEEARARLAPACERLEIAGSIRRGGPTSPTWSWSPSPG